MKNYKDMADAVFRRRDEYVASVNRKKKIALNAGISLCTICLAILGAFGIWKTGVLSPDPDVIGTKPQNFTEATLHSLNSNATSEGEHFETTELISGNTKPQLPSGNNIKPTEEDKTQSTDPAEKVTRPVAKPTLPTLPIGPKPPVVTPGDQNIPPASTDKHPQPTVATDPIEDITAATDGDVDYPTTNKPPAPSTTPPMDGENNGSSDEPEEPTNNPPVEEATPGPETDKPCTNDPSEPLSGEPMAPVPPTESTTPSVKNTIEGKAVDQYGNPVKGAVVSVYSGKNLVGSSTTDSDGYYFISGFKNTSGSENYAVISSVPSGYTASGTNIYFSGAYNYIVLNCNKK